MKALAGVRGCCHGVIIPDEDLGVVVRILVEGVAAVPHVPRPCARQIGRPAPCEQGRAPPRS